VRVDGDIIEGEGSKTFYAELVWLPSLGSYRGIAQAWSPSPEPEPKSIDEFIASINAIADDETETFEGLILDAAEGIDGVSKDLPLAYSAVFSLFERFPQEDFGNPGVLVFLLEKRGEYKRELNRSLSRKPSIPAVTLVGRLLRGDLTGDERAAWIASLREVASSNAADIEVRELARELFEFH